MYVHDVVLYSEAHMKMDVNRGKRAPGEELRGGPTVYTERLPSAVRLGSETDRKYKKAARMH
jgi:hypothetical protein